jgi:hypothetical protein
MFGYDRIRIRIRIRKTTLPVVLCSIWGNYGLLLPVYARTRLPGKKIVCPHLAVKFCSCPMHDASPLFCLRLSLLQNCLVRTGICLSVGEYLGMYWMYVYRVSYHEKRKQK